MKIIFKESKLNMYGKIPANMQAIGEVKYRGVLDGGALVYIPETALFAQMSIGTLKNLDQSQTYCEIIRALRRESGLTQAEFAQKCRVSISTAQKWEIGARKPQVSQIVLILIEAGYLNV